MRHFFQQKYKFLHISNLIFKFKFISDGFRKMTPLSQGGLTRTESDQDHLEFSHPCFVQGRPELLSQIKRKVQEAAEAQIFQISIIFSSADIAKIHWFLLKI